MRHTCISIPSLCLSALLITTCDEDGNVVLGIAGSAAEASQYVRILPQ